METGTNGCRHLLGNYVSSLSISVFPSSYSLFFFLIFKLTVPKGGLGAIRKYVK